MKPAHFLLMVALFLAACGPRSDPPSAATHDVPALQTEVMATIAANLTAAVTPTATFTPAPTATHTPSPTPTPVLDFSQARVLSVGFTRAYALLVVVSIPNLYNDSGEYRGRIDQHEYRCVRDVTYPERLFCFGHALRPNTRWTFELLPAGMETVLISQSITIPEPPIPGDLTKYWQGNCEVEPLYQPFRPELTWAQNPANAGCYAITCYGPDPYDPNRTVYKCGTHNTCVSMPEEPCP